MSGMSIRKENDLLLLDYSPQYGAEDICEQINTGKLVKKTFWIEQKNIYSSNLDIEELTFIIGKREGDYYKLDKDVFVITHNFFIHSDIKLSINWFIANYHISIIRRIDELVDDDVYVVVKDEGINNHIPQDVYKKMVENFPNTYECKRYSEARITYLLANYVEGLWNNHKKYENYLKKKEERLKLQKQNPLECKKLGLEMYEAAYEELKNMLENPEGFEEPDWQEKVYQIICVVYPKYICSYREIEVGYDGRHRKRPDFLLIDSQGFVDVLEIKKPNNISVMTRTEYRDNYVASRDLEGAIVQIEKYLYILNHDGKSREQKIKEKIREKEKENAKYILPEHIKIQVINPQGILLLGRSNDLTEDQKKDFEIIKRKNKNIIDIMTYDDLLERLKNILNQLQYSDL